MLTPAAADSRIAGRRVARAIPTLVLVLLSHGCGGGEGSTAPLIPAALQVVSGGGVQSGVAGDTVPQRPRVRVVTASGKPVTSSVVTFTVTAGGGSVLTALASPDADGVATPGRWLLGTQAGQNTLVASVAGAAGVTPVTFTVNAVAGAPASIRPTIPFAELDVGESLPLGGQALDPFGNVIGGASYTFESLTPSIVGVSPSGVVSGISAGNGTVVIRSGAAARTVLLYVAGSPGTDVVTNFMTTGAMRASAVAGARWVFSASSPGTIARYDLLALDLATPWTAGVQPRAMALLSDESRLYVGVESPARLVALRSTDGLIQATIPLPAPASRIAVARNGTIVVVTTDSGDVVTLDAATDAVVRTIRLPARANGLALSRSGARAFVSTTAGGIYTIDGAGAPVLALTLSGAPQGLALSPDGTRLYVARDSAEAAIVEPGTMTVVGTLALTEGAHDVAVTHDGTQVWVTQPAALMVRLFNTSDHIAFNGFGTGIGPRHLSFDRSGLIGILNGDSGVLIVR